jgi:hypothetical protein
MKTCTKCKLTKDISDFNFRKERGYYNTQCKHCSLLIRKAWKAKNPEKVKIAEKKNNEKRKESRKKWWKTYYENNRELIAIRGKLSREKHKENVKNRKRKYIEENREKVYEYNRNWRANNQEKVRIRTEAYKDKQIENARKHRLKYPERVIYYGILRRSKIQQATPKWLTKKQRKEMMHIYQSCKARSVFHEESFHVDHIEPLKGKTSCGLHVPWNLQILPAKENIKKSNKIT